MATAVEKPYRNATFNEVWKKDFFSYINEKPEAEQHWLSLIFGGNPFLLTRLAFLALDVPIDTLELRRNDLKTFAKRIRAKQSKIHAVVRVINDFNNELAHNCASSCEDLELPEKMREYADFLGGLRKVVIKLSSDRLPTTGDYLLFFLHAYILRSTGKPHWRAMATLLEAARWATYRRDFECDDECLRKKINGMPDRDPHLCAHLKQKVEHYIISGNGDWPSADDLNQIAIDVANELNEAFPPRNLNFSR